MAQVVTTPHKVVVTAKTGPASQVTALNVLSVTGVAFDLTRGVMIVTQDQAVVMNPLAASPADGQSDNVKEYDIAAAATITVAIAAGAYTVTVVA